MSKFKAKLWAAFMVVSVAATGTAFAQDVPEAEPGAEQGAEPATEPSPTAQPQPDPQSQPQPSAEQQGMPQQGAPQQTVVVTPPTEPLPRKGGVFRRFMDGFRYR